jgi:DNA-binding PadR family transcriptional regulator
MRRGDVRGEVLAALLDGPAHGYEVIRRLEEKSSGMWRPSAGSVYPTLQMLEDAGLARSSEQDGKRVYELTDEGRAEAEQQQAQGTPAWDFDNPDMRTRIQVKEAIGQLHMAAVQVARTGSPEQIERATTVLRQARQSLYQILAEA